jgi:hypothetical protein
VRSGLCIVKDEKGDYTYLIANINNTRCMNSIDEDNKKPTVIFFPFFFALNSQSLKAKWVSSQTVKSSSF